MQARDFVAATIARLRPSDSQPAGPNEITLVGAFERHNFGDWLMGWTFSRLLAAHPTRWASVTPSSHSAPTPHRLVDLRELASSPMVSSTPVLHVGGETIACRMDVAMAITWPQTEWTVDSAGRALGLDRCAAYITPATERVAGAEVVWGPRFFYGLGGTDLAAQPIAYQHAVAAQLEGARWLGVRDEATLATLQRLGLRAELVPDVVSLYPALRPPLLAPSGRYAVVQCADSLTPTQLAEALARALGDREIVVCVAGVAGYHDSMAGSKQLVDELRRRGARARLAPDLSPHRIAALIGGADLVISSSLHVQILAAAYGRRHVSFSSTKTARYAATWEPWQLHADEADPGALVELVQTADRLDERELAEHAARMIERTADAVTQCLAALVGVGAPHAPWRVALRHRAALRSGERRDAAELATLDQRSQLRPIELGSSAPLSTR